MNITIEKYQLAVDQFGDFSRFLVTLKDQQGKSKVLNVECSNTVQHVWKIDDREELFRALFPILKNKIKELMNKEIRTVDQLPVIRFSSSNVPKYAPNEALSLPHTFNLSGRQADQALQEKKLEKFPFQPDSVKEIRSHVFEEGELDTDTQINDLVLLMFEYPEREFYFFHNTKVQFSPKLRFTEKENIILLNEVECFYYKHPKHEKDYVKISGNNPKFDWQKELIKNGPEFHRHVLRLTQKAKRDLEISYKNDKKKQEDSAGKKVQPNWGKISVMVGIAALVLMIVIPVSCHHFNKTESAQAQFVTEQKIANGLYSELLLAQDRLQKGKKDIKITKIRAYFSSGEYLSLDTHTQISNFLTSIDNRNFNAAKEQIDDVISQIERKYGCHISDIQVGVDTNHPAISADNVTIPRR